MKIKIFSIIFPLGIFLFFLKLSFDIPEISKQDFLRKNSLPLSKKEEQGMHPAAVNYFVETYRDPATNRIPPGVRRKELAFVESLKNAGKLGKTRSLDTIEWVEAGPSDVGGRTRTLVVDAADSRTLLVGGITGGIWKSIDKGITWRSVSVPGQDPGVTALAQDPRPGHTNTWYYGSGEWRGDFASSDRGSTTFYHGIGIYKSTDNAESWELLAETQCCKAATDLLSSLILSLHCVFATPRPT